MQRRWAGGGLSKVFETDEGGGGRRRRDGGRKERREEAERDKNSKGP